MFKSPLFLCILALFIVALGVGWQNSLLEGSQSGTIDKPSAQVASDKETDALQRRFVTDVRPVLERNCFACHGPKKQKGALDLSRDMTLTAIVSNFRHWELALEKLQSKEMPPEDAPRQPEPAERAAVIAWIKDLRAFEVERNAGDPGIVLARRLSNAEFDNTIRDLTGVDIRPAREFPVDPANQAGFDNSGESLTMSGPLLAKYLTAARFVADHVVLKPEGFVFAPHPVVSDPDRDKYCVKRIIDFYDRHKVDYAAYFLAAHEYRNRGMSTRPNAKLSDFAAAAGLSPKYLELIWSALNEADADVGPLAAIRKMWNELPVGPASQAGPEKTGDSKSNQESGALQIPLGKRDLLANMSDLALRLRKQLKAEAPKMQAPGISPGSQPFVLWRNRKLAAQHRSYSGKAYPDLAKLAAQLKKNEAELEKLFSVAENDPETEGKLRKSLERFCAVFPDTFAVTDRGAYFDANLVGKGRLLTAGFHLMQGYFRDDDPLCELILNEAQKRELDALWDELNFITLVLMRQYRDYIFFERAEPPRFMFEAEFDFARSEDKDATS